MMFEWLPTALTVATTVVLCSGLWAQIVLHVAKSSARGLSVSSMAFAMLISFLGFYFTIVYRLPAVFLYLHGSTFLLRGVLLGQCAWYAKKSRTVALQVLAVWGCFCLLVGALVLLGEHAEFIGWLVGWFLAFSPIPLVAPQLLHNWREDGVEGFSRSHLFANEYTAVLYGLSVMMFGLPVQALVQAALGLVLRSCELVQHLYYWRKKRDQDQSGV